MMYAYVYVNILKFYETHSRTVRDINGHMFYMLYYDALSLFTNLFSFHISLFGVWTNSFIFCNAANFLPSLIIFLSSCVNIFVSLGFNIVESGYFNLPKRHYKFIEKIESIFNKFPLLSKWLFKSQFILATKDPNSPLLNKINLF